MLVEDVMQAAVITISPKTSLPEAMRLVRNRGIRHLPVVENDTLVGIVSDRDLKRAMACQARINPLKDVVYGMGEPTGDAHARMKYAMMLAGRLSSAVVRPPTHQPDESTRKQIENVLRAAGMLHKQAA